MDHLFEGYKNFIVGANYFASHAGTHMWQQWDKDIVEKDLKILKEHGIEVLRVFPIWSDFQPITSQYVHGLSYEGAPREVTIGDHYLDDSPEGKAGVSKVMFEHFDEFCLLAQKYDIKLIVGLLTGFMSDRRFVPPALNDRNIFTDHFAQKWTVKYIKYFVQRYKNSDVIIAWDFGNEVRWLDKAASSDNIYVWASLITNTIKSIDNVRPVVTGLDQSETEKSEWNTLELGEIADVMTSHPYACFSYAMNKPINTIKAIRFVAGTTVAIGDISNKPCFVEEVGSIGYSTLNERAEAEFMRSILFDSWANNCYGLMWWCAFDQGVLSVNPYRWNGRGSDYGLFSEDRRVKPVAKEAKRFYDLIRSLPFKYLPERIRDAVCIIPKGSPTERNYVAMLDTLAKQAGLDFMYSFADQPLKDAPLYVIPSVSSAQYVNKDTFVKLLEKVRNGADLFISMDNCYLRWFEEVTGLNVYQRTEHKGNGEITLYGEKVRSFAKYEYICDSIDGEVIAALENSAPAFIRHRLGNGNVYSFLAPYEKGAMSYSDVTESNTYYVYRYLRDNVKTKKVAKCLNSQVGLTEHILNEEERVLVLINYSCESVNIEVVLPDEWQIDAFLYGNSQGQLEIAKNDALILKIKKK
ncbi:MAG: cellulase family glycosylhydrolase [Clostridia bacterium]|nr:cellulase family glycosylhydrolase [Clostridia bacterium]